MTLLPTQHTRSTCLLPGMIGRHCKTFPSESNCTIMQFFNPEKYVVNGNIVLNNIPCSRKLWKKEKKAKHKVDAFIKNNYEPFIIHQNKI